MYLSTQALSFCLVFQHTISRYTGPWHKEATSLGISTVLTIKLCLQHGSPESARFIKPELWPPYQMSIKTYQHFVQDFKISNAFFFFEEKILIIQKITSSPPPPPPFLVFLCHCCSRGEPQRGQWDRRATICLAASPWPRPAAFQVCWQMCLLKNLLETTALVAEGLQPASCAHSLWSKGEDMHPRMYLHWVDSPHCSAPPNLWVCSLCSAPELLLLHQPNSQLPNCTSTLQRARRKKVFVLD